VSGALTIRTVWKLDTERRKLAVSAGELRVCYFNPIRQSPEDARVTGDLLARKYVDGPYRVLTGADLAIERRALSWDAWAQTIALAREGGHAHGRYLIDAFFVPQRIIGRATATTVQAILAEQAALTPTARQARLFLVQGGLHPITGVDAVRDPWDWRVVTNDAATASTASAAMDAFTDDPWSTT
jgi:hypothetical protein